MLHRFALGALACAALALPSSSAQPLAGLPLSPHDTCVLEVADPGRSVPESELVRLPTHTVERQGAASTFIVTYDGFTAQAQTAFQHAVDIWADHIESAAPIRVNASFANLASGVLGSAGAADLALNRPEFEYADTVYPIALAEAIVGAEFDGVFRDAFDINARFSSAFPNFYFGTDGNTPSGQYDFATVVLHELGHGLGFAGSGIYESTPCTGAGQGCFRNTGLPFVYDLFVEDASGTDITDGTTYSEGSTAFGSLITSNQLYNSAPSVTATLGTRGRLYAPGSWNQGSSYSHWNEATYQGTSAAMMTPQIGTGESYQDPGANTCAFFGDMGWPLGAACVSKIQKARSVTVAGNEGWRMLAAPDGVATVDELLGSTHTQGFPGADSEDGDANVYFYDETQPGTDAVGYRAPTSQSEALPLGRGLFAYLYADDDQATPGTQGGFPKVLGATGTPATSDFTWSGASLLSYTDTGAPADDGWNLLGNPFETALDWDDATRSGVDGAVYVYDDATSGYRSYSAGAGDLAGGVVAPFQAFWVKAAAASPSLELPPAAGAGTFYRQDGERLSVALRLGAADGSPLGAAESRAFVVWGTDGADAALDALDAWALASPAPASVTLAALVGGEALAIDHRPALDGTADVDLGVAVSGTETGELVLTWDAVEAEDDVRVTLIDQVTGAELDLGAAGSYSFTAAGTAAPGSGLRTTGLASRFTLRASSGSATSDEAAPALATLSAPAPNPARGAASLRLTVPSTERVRAAVYDALGREVAVLHDGDASGTVELRVDAASLSAGVYVVRVAGESFAGVQRLTVVR